MNTLITKYIGMDQQDSKDETINFLYTCVHMFLSFILCNAKKYNHNEKKIPTTYPSHICQDNYETSFPKHWQDVSPSYVS